MTAMWPPSTTPVSKTYCGNCDGRGDVLHSEDCPQRPHVEPTDIEPDDYDDIARKVRLMLDSWDPWSKRPTWSKVGPSPGG